MIGENRQNDEKNSKSKIYKVLDKNVIEKKAKTYYTYNRERIHTPAQKINLWRKHK